MRIIKESDRHYNNVYFLGKGNLLLKCQPFYDNLISQDLIYDMVCAEDRPDVAYEPYEIVVYSYTPEQFAHMFKAEFEKPCKFIVVRVFILKEDKDAEDGLLKDEEGRTIIDKVLIFKDSENESRFTFSRMPKGEKLITDPVNLNTIKDPENKAELN